MSVDEASVRGVRPVAARANSHRARTAPARGEGCAAGIVGVLSSIADSRGHCEYSSVVDDMPLTVRLTVYRYVADVHVQAA